VKEFWKLVYFDLVMMKRSRVLLFTLSKVKIRG